MVLDEEATAAAFGDTGLILPVWQQGTERWLQVDLVVDTSASMVIWQQTAAQLHALLERHGAFRNVRAWAVDSDQPDPRLVPFSRRPSAPSALSAITRSPTELIDPTGRRAVLVLTDAVGKGWHGGEMMTHLLPWAGSCPLAIIQVLPRRLWHRTALETVAVTARMRPGSRWPFHVVHVDDWAPGRPVGWVPVLYPSAEWLGPLGGHGRRHGRAASPDVRDAAVHHQARDADLPDGGDVPASERLRMFSDHEASPEALELAGILGRGPPGPARDAPGPTGDDAGIGS